MKEKRVQVNTFVIMNNHIHLIWQVQEGFKREDIQRDFLKFTSQTIKRDLKENHPAVLEKFLVKAKDRKYQIWERNPLSVDLSSKNIFIQKMNYIHYNPVEARLASYSEQHKYSSAKFYETGVDEIGFITHWLD